MSITPAKADGHLWACARNSRQGMTVPAFQGRDGIINMKTTRNRLLKKSLDLHRYLTWIGAIGLALFIASALTHPLMIWTGPMPATFTPPDMTLSAETVPAVRQTLARHNIREAAIVKLVPGETTPLLQVSTTLTGPKRYFEPSSGDEIIGQDEAQAIWLARYYSGLKDTAITGIGLQSEFDNGYPWVNRLLPVYKIDFDTPDGKSIYVHTETGAMASYSNNYKSVLQSICQLFHTWSWLDNLEILRLAALIVMLLSIFGLLTGGIGLLLLMKKRRIAQKSRRFHRYLAYGISLPLFASLISGSYHLVASSFEDSSRSGIHLQTPLLLDQPFFTAGKNWEEAYRGVKFNAMSLVHGPDDGLYYRLGIAQDIKQGGGHGIHGGAHAHHGNGQNERFDGMPSERSSIYISVNSQTEKALNDHDQVLFYARTLLNKPADTQARATLITRFGPEYDFRNKRLPVWQVIFNDQPEDILLIDPVSGILVERMATSSLIERYSFSWLHKWDFMVPFTGRMGRDGLVMLFLGSLFILLCMGIYLKLKSTFKRTG